MQFSQEVWAQAAGVRAAMREMPFNRELAAGTLSRDSFRHYMIQDALYLEGFGRALAFAAGKAPGPAELLEFSEAAKTAIVVERALHGGYLAQFGIDADALAGAEASPTCEAYVNSLLSTAATGSFGELAAAVLPCFWVYREVGLHIAAQTAPNNFYQAWIDTYADEAFGAATERMIGVVDRAAAAAGAFERGRMRTRFLRCCQYEWLFWDAAYRCEAWAVPGAPANVIAPTPAPG